MKIINAGYEVIKEQVLTKKIERIARICYKSEDKIGKGTDTKMLTDLLQRQHLAMLEHGDICMEVTYPAYDLIINVINTIENVITETDNTDKIPKKIYLRHTITVLEDKSTRYVISGNIRAWYDFFLEAAAVGALYTDMYTIVNEELNELLDTTPLMDMEIGINTNKWGLDRQYAEFKQIKDLSILTPAERMVHETITVLFTVDRGVTHELVRHRDCSFAQESTRYCNYSLGKYNNEITVIKPCFFDPDEDDAIAKYWQVGCEDAEEAYFELLEAGAKPQQARDVLPTSTKAEIVLTINLREWKHIFNLRACDSTGSAHPQMKEVMVPLFKELRCSHRFAFGNMVAADEVHP